MPCKCLIVSYSPDGGKTFFTNLVCSVLVSVWRKVKQLVLFNERKRPDNSFSIP